MIDHALTRIRQLVAEKKVTLKQVAEAAGLPISTVHEMTQPDWGTRAVTNLKSLEQALPGIEALAEQPAQGAAP